MKKLLLSVAVIATMGLSSCGEEKKEADEKKADHTTADDVIGPLPKKDLDEKKADHTTADDVIGTLPKKDLNDAVCDCLDMSIAIMNEMKDCGEDMEKQKEIESKYIEDIKKCQALGEGKTEEELKAMEEDMKECPSYQEMEEMMQGLGN